MMNDKELNEFVLDDDLLQDVTGGIIGSVPSPTELRNITNEVNRQKSANTGLCQFCGVFKSTTSIQGKQRMFMHIKESHNLR